MIIRKVFSGAEEKLSVFLTIGFFDGVHRGHQKIISEIVEKAKLNNLRSCVATFDLHPTEFFSGKIMRFLTSWEEKKEIFRLLGVNWVQVFTFDSQFANLSPQEFLQKLNEIFDIRQIVVGEEFNFGLNREGNINFLYQKQAEFGYQLRTIPSLRLDGEKIGSSLLRKWLEEGKVNKVVQGLGRFSTIIGKVIAERGKGQGIGCPTVSLQTDSHKLLPGGGVYVGYLEEFGGRHKVVINIGEKPTFEDFTLGVEVHIIDFRGDLYGKTLKVNLVEKIRDTHPFLSPVHFSRQLKKDKERAKRILTDYTFLFENC